MSPTKSPESLTLPKIAILPKNLTGLTIFGKNQTGFIYISDELKERITNNIENNEKILEKIFFPFLWYEFDLNNNLKIASTSAPQISKALVDIKCTPTNGESVIIPSGSSNWFFSRLTTIDKLDYGCTISQVHSNKWTDLNQEKELIIEFEGDFKLDIKPTIFSQFAVLSFFYFLIAIPIANLLRKSLYELTEFVRGRRRTK
ncbi:MAG: hypothetical protein Q7R91_01480 [bacterium]|nr:hypothetical protein [bacterium]